MENFPPDGLPESSTVPKAFGELSQYDENKTLTEKLKVPLPKLTRRVIRVKSMWKQVLDYQKVNNEFQEYLISVL